MKSVFRKRQEICFSDSLRNERFDVIRNELAPDEAVVVVLLAAGNLRLLRRVLRRLALVLRPMLTFLKHFKKGVFYTAKQLS
jgi:hypothetical protein